MRCAAAKKDEFKRCTKCGWHGNYATRKCLSIMWRAKHDSIHAFQRVSCPVCRELIEIVFETIGE